MKELNTFRQFINEGKLDDIRLQIYKGMDLIDSALGKAKGIIPQEDWDSLYALVSKIESKAERIKDVKEKVNESFDNDMESRYATTLDH